MVERRLRGNAKAEKKDETVDKPLDKRDQVMESAMDEWGC